jgi:hypothetical protein
MRGEGVKKNYVGYTSGMGRKKLDRKPRTINVSDDAWQKALDLAAAETTDTHKGKPSHVIERLLLEAPDPKPTTPEADA